MFVLRRSETLGYLALSLTLFLGLASPVRTQASSSVSFDVTGYTITGELPGNIRNVDSLLAPYTGTFNNTEGIQDAADTLEKALHAKGYTFVRIVIPRQPLDDGEIELQVLSLTLDKISISGNQNFGRENIRNSLPSLVHGESPNRNALARNLDVGRVHPSRKEKITFTASDLPGKVDAQIQVQDQKPSKVFSWLNNTGNDETGRYRLGLGYQNSNLFDRDHNATLTYTTSPTETSKVDQFGVVYQVPLYESGALITVLLSESDVNSGRVAEFFDVAGKGSVKGLQFTRFFARKDGYAQQIELAINDKLFDNDIDFAGEALGIDVRSRPLSLQYKGNLRNNKFESDFNLQLAGNLSSGSHNNRVAYASSRVGASDHWSLIRYGASIRKTIRNWSLSGRFRGQYSNEPLIGGEQFGVGGSNSIRGFREREVSGDKGYLFQLEAWTPKWGKQPARGVIFVEKGHSKLIDPLPGEMGSDSIFGIGAGVSWTFKSRLSMRLDIGYAVDGVDSANQGSTRDGDERVHLNLGYQW
ncbi:MAG: hemolysin activation/secretion protein [Parasphingorhabdus sp.]